jgi:hypothetical protein
VKSKFSISVAAALLAAGFAAPALADQTSPVLVTMNYVSGVGSKTQKGTFTDTLSTAGIFTDSYIFNSPPAIATDSFTATAGTGITFTSVVFTYFNSTTPLPLTGSLTGSSITESAGTVNSALYEITITGTATAGASYTGTITAASISQTAPVPEPASWAMMLAGLTATGAFLGRRRKTLG